MTTAAGTWATVAIGALGDPVNTFWQLLERPAGASTWVERTTGTGAATNGGLLVSPATAGSGLVVAVPPSQGLAFSPVVTTTAGASWPPGAPAPALSATASSLAASGPGALAVAAGGGRLVATPDVGAGTWATLAGAGAVAARSRCATPVLHAVAAAGGGVLAGGTCAAAGAVGLWSSTGAAGAAWSPDAPSLPPALSGDRSDVLWLAPSAGGAALALVAAGPEVVAARRGPGGTWTTSAPLPATAVDAAAATADGGVVAVVGDPAAPQVVAWSPGSWGPAASSAAGWARLPGAPPGTAVAVDGAGGTWTALAATPLARPTTITVWTLAPGAAAWQRGQVIDVPVPFGSSA